MPQSRQRANCKQESERASGQAPAEQARMCALTHNVAWFVVHSGLVVRKKHSMAAALSGLSIERAAFRPAAFNDRNRTL